jgi:hypothetical protein
MMSGSSHQFFNLMKKIFLIYIFSLILLIQLLPQEPGKITLNGYITSMQSVMFDSLKGNYINQNMIHNRLNFKAYFNDNITFGVEMRNRLFLGDMIRTNPWFATSTGFDPGIADLSWNLINERSVLLNTSIDRCWLDLNYGKIQVKLGRQRINWGQTLVWNPNDIFNAYSVFDFDYVERPGSDAIRIQYYPGTESTAEVAIKSGRDNKITAAGLYRFNRKSYDIQFLAGYFHGEDIVAGTGWSGSLGGISFRGEATWFQPASHFSDTIGRGVFTTGFDKVFKDNSSVQLQIMYCNDPLKLTNFDSLYKGDLSSKDLAFSKFSAYGQYSYQATPLLNMGVSGMWLPDLNGFFAGASLEYSVAEDLDFSFIWQHFNTEMKASRSRINMCFLRMKWNF